ncbi:hypothetical protein BDV96DRAFT_348012 [Lophiotrema nucula]|uniref:C2H2-type domain-containing protein n=1 Tax=Lophiotrema nucula TaxID=690887 RepID=A0A6A5ZL00_9PLEO|nr:hypothetical protein BDV96DRAFT_348012 [Lophiotrema nucula]
MTKKRKRWPDLQQKLDRPWCYYCDRDFDDLKILISHQKAKHFKCDRCGRRLNTAGGLSVHMSQVHKESLSHVENALPGKQNLDNEIFGMEGVPADEIERHNHEVTAKHFAEEQERARISGNPVRGLFSSGTGATSKRSGWKRETVEDIKVHAEEFRKHKLNGTLPPRVDELPAPGPPAQAPGAPAPAFSPPGQGFPPPGAPGAPGAPGYPPGQPFYGGPPPPGGPPGLPQRPQIGGPPPGFPPFPGQNGHAPSAANEISASLDDLIADAKGAAAAAPPAEGPPEKKAKKEKDKNIHLVFYHDTMSPEELMAELPRYAAVN